MFGEYTKTNSPNHFPADQGGCVAGFLCPQHVKATAGHLTGLPSAIPSRFDIDSVFILIRSSYSLSDPQILRHTTLTHVCVYKPPKLLHLY